MSKRTNEGTIGSRVIVACAALLVFASVLTFGGATATTAVAATSGLRDSSTTTYVVDPAAQAVHVTVDLSATNTTSDVHTSRGIERSYFPSLIVPALGEAMNFSATSSRGGSLSVTTRAAASPLVKGLEVHIPNLFSGETESIQLHYDLPNGAPRSQNLTRVTAAFATFSAWPSSFTAGTANVVIVVPKSFTVDYAGDQMQRHPDGSTVTYSADAIAEPDQWYVTVSARDDAHLQARKINIAGNQIVVRAFPDDPTWGSFVQTRLRSGFPALERLIGLPWPRVGDLVITETVTPYIYGYAGWYSSADNTIEIGDALDPQVVLHEVSHAWFNNHMFDSRWIDEGLAQEYAARTVAATGGALVSPKPVDAHDPAALPLTSWSDVDPKAQNSQAREAFGYNASWFVIRGVTQEIGLAGMRRVFVAADRNQLPYRGRPNTPGANPAAGDAGAKPWNRFLDYVDETGRAHRADAIFARYVVPAADTDLTARAAARRQYAALTRAGAGWFPPLLVRETMTNWNFDDAEATMRAATKTLATRWAIDAAGAPIGLTAPGRLRADYEYGVADSGSLQHEADADLDAVKTVRAATGAVHAHHGLLASIGLVAASDKSDLATARADFGKGDAAGAKRAALAAEHAVDDAQTAGLIRLAIAVAVVLVLALVVRLVRRRRRRRSGRSIEDAFGEPDPVPGNGPVGAGFAG